MLLQAAHTFCVSVLYVHVVFDDRHVLNLMYVRACMCLPQDQANFYMYIYISFFFFKILLNIDLFLGLLVSISTWFV